MNEHIDTDMSYHMNRMQETLDRRERSINWAAKKRGLTRQGLTWKMINDSFSADDKEFYSDLLLVPVAELFPETESITQEVEA